MSGNQRWEGGRPRYRPPGEPIRPSDPKQPDPE